MDIRELYQQQEYNKIVSNVTGKDINNFSDENDVYRIGRSYQHLGDFRTSSDWFKRLTEINPIEDSYRRYLEVNLQSGDFGKVKAILKEMEEKNFLSEYYYAARYELEKINGADDQILIEILSDMIKEYKIAYYMITLAVLYIENDQTKEAGKVLRKVIRLFVGDKCGEYAIKLNDAISAGKEKEFVAKNVCSEKGLFGIIRNIPKEENDQTLILENNVSANDKIELEKTAKEDINTDITNYQTSEVIHEETPDLSVIYTKKKEEEKEKNTPVSNRNLLQSVGINPDEKNKKEEENARIPASVAKSMEGIVGFEEVADMLSTFHDFVRINRSRAKMGYVSSDLYNFAVKGERGFGTSTAARVIALSLKNMGIVSNDNIVVASCDDIVGINLDETLDNVQKLFQNAAGSVIHIDHIEDFYTESLSLEMEAIKSIEKAMFQLNEMGTCVVITGAGENYDNLLKNRRNFADLFKFRTELKPFTTKQLRKILDNIASEQDFGIVENKEGKIEKIIEKRMKEPDFEYTDTLISMIDDAYHTKMPKRIPKRMISKDGKKEILLLIDDDFETEEKMDTDIEELLNKLDGMVGLKEVKEEVKKLISQVRIKAQEKEQGINSQDGFGNLNLIFVGNPGTGKTTVARIIAEIYRSLGVLSKGHMVEVKRADLVAEYMGGTSKLTTRKVNEAIGGVLFIDEAYDLWHGSSDRYGQESINTLIDIMEKNYDNLMVIMAGYEEEMDDLIQNANAGLASRMKTKVHFEDYTTSEMVTIFKQMLKDRGKRLDLDLDDKIQTLITIRSKERNFGNARGIRNLVESVIAKQAVRIQEKNLNGERLDKSDFLIIREADLDIPEDGSAPKTRNVEELLDKLNNMTGLTSVKRKVNELVNLARSNEERKKRGLKVVGNGSLHLVFQGGPGTGKTTVARIIGEIYKGLGLLKNGHTIETDASGLIGTAIGISAEKTKEAIKQALGGILFIDEAYALLNEGTKAYGQEVIDTLLKGMEDHRDDLMVIVAGYPEPMDRFITSNDGLKSRLKTRIDFDDYSPNEMLEIFKKTVSSNGMLLEPNAEKMALKYFGLKAKEQGFGNARGVRNIFEDLKEKQASRICSLEFKNLSDKDFQMITCEDFETLSSGLDNDETEENIDELLRELNEMTGLDSVKEEINQLVVIERNNQERRKLGMKTVSGGALHMVFQGSAGTGKTTVARILGKIYKGLGLLSGGQTIETDYSGLVANYTGQTADKTNNQIKKAIGGVLFIDEAYTLADTSRGGFGQEAIDTLLKAMEDYRDDFMVIVAGYPKPMQCFIDSNEGLNSRFKTKITFEDYSPEEMLEIFKNNLKRSDLEIDEETENVALKYFQKKAKEKNFGNARGVRNTVEELIKKQNMRISQLSEITADDLKMIKTDDFYQLDPFLDE